MDHAERAARRIEMADRVRAGETVAALAEEYGVSQATVRNACKEHGIDLNRKATIMEIVALALQGKTPEEIDGHFPATSSTIIRSILEDMRRAGIEPGQPAAKGGPQLPIVVEEDTCVRFPLAGGDHLDLYLLGNSVRVLCARAALRITPQAGNSCLLSADRSSP